MRRLKKKFSVAAANAGQLGVLLLKAVEKRGVRIGEVRELLDRGAPIEITNDKNSTPLLKAALNKRLDVMRLLIERGANLDRQIRYDKSPLVTHCIEWASVSSRGNRPKDARRFTAALKLLIKAGANVNVPNAESGKTPLMMAAGESYANPEAMKILLDAGARTGIRDKEGKTASDYATPQMQALLKKYLQKRAQSMQDYTSQGMPVGGNVRPLARIRLKPR